VYWLACRTCNPEVLGSIPGSTRLISCSGLTKPVILSGSAYWYQFRLGYSGRATNSLEKLYLRVINLAYSLFTIENEANYKNRRQLISVASGKRSVSFKNCSGKDEILKTSAAGQYVSVWS
jgi:hypothetical protein